MASRLGIRSAYSFLYGVRSPQDIAQRLRSDGATALGITDRNGLYGLPAVLEAVQEAGLKPVVGAELVCSEGSVFCFALNRLGFSRLSEILTAIYRNAALDGRALGTLLGDNSRGLAVATAVPSLLTALAGRVPRLYGALSPRNLAVIPPARRLNLPLIALDDATLLDTSDMEVHRVLRAIALGKTVGTLGPGDTVEAEDRYLPIQERDRRLASWPDAVTAAEALAQEAQFDRLFNGYLFPEYGRPEGRTVEDILRERVYAGAEARYGELSDPIVERIEYELDIINQKGFASYFLIMDDIVSMAARTCGRGSGAASIVAYALSITPVDPLAHNLYFERFLNPARLDPPDIDVDFPWDERDDLIHRVMERFGSDRCGRVANHLFFRFSSALRETARAYGLADVEISRFQRRLLEHREGPGRRGLDTETLEEPWKGVYTLALRLEGLPRGIGTHCGGLVIAPAPLGRYVPVTVSAEGYPLVAWEKEGTEAAGFIKLDLLGNRSLAVIRDALENLREQGTVVDFNRIRPEEDRETIEALARGNSLGVFYIESPAMRQLQKKTARGDFEHIVIHSSIIRPAANRFIAEYVRRLKGGAWKPLHPRLERILRETYGILCYQEDVSKTAVALADFDEASADGLRKIIAKKAGGKKLEEYKSRFYQGCQKNLVDTEVIDAVWAMMLSFDGYSFCKGHSASYAVISFQAAYLRVHYGAPFMAAVLSNQGGYYHSQAYISEARRMGLILEGPDVNRSRFPYYGEGPRLVVGLMALGGLSKAGAEGLIAERDRNGPYKSLEDVCERIRLHRDDTVALVSAGVFDSIAPGIPRSAQSRYLLTGSSRYAEGPALFPGTGDGSSARPVDAKEAGPPYARKGKPDTEELLGEFSTLGFLREHHPLYLWKKALGSHRTVRAVDMEKHSGHRITLVGWPITRKEIWTQEGLTMNFISFEDETALYETVLFPRVYERYRSILFDIRPFLVTGTVQNDQGALCIQVSQLVALEAAPHSGSIRGGGINDYKNAI